ncbi:MAG: hypothetical protein BYD32DRAFT_418788 [Podila humilis]|nr:MAG: hypothetical protein BYD32DRAFT_418788 [Podila humilis]
MAAMGCQHDLDGVLLTSAKERERLQEQTKKAPSSTGTRSRSKGFSSEGRQRQREKERIPGGSPLTREWMGDGVNYDH